MICGFPRKIYNSPTVHKGVNNCPPKVIKRSHYPVDYLFCIDISIISEMEVQKENRNILSGRNRISKEQNKSMEK